MVWKLISWKHIVEKGTNREENKIFTELHGPKHLRNDQSCGTHWAPNQRSGPAIWLGPYGRPGWPGPRRPVLLGGPSSCVQKGQGRETLFWSPKWQYHTLLPLISLWCCFLHPGDSAYCINILLWVFITIEPNFMNTRCSILYPQILSFCIQNPDLVYDSQFPFYAHSLLDPKWLNSRCTNCSYSDFWAQYMNWIALTCILY